MMEKRRVNLLPVELEIRRRGRKRTVSLAAASAALVVALAGAYLFERMRLSDEKSALQAQQDTNAGLRAQVQQLADFDKLDRELKRKSGLIADLTKDEVRWSVLFADTSLVIPQEAWLTSLIGSVQVSGGTTAPASTAASPLGSITMNGVTFTHLDVAKWLTRLGDVDEFSFPYLTLSAKATIGTTGVVNFNSSVQLSEKAFRRNQPGAERDI